MKQNINVLGQDFTFLKLVLFTLPSMCMMLFTSTYTIIDGIFVSNWVGEDALAAVNLVFPIFNVVFAISLMFATGGNAVIGKMMGEGKNQEAKEFMSVLFLVGTVLGGIMTTVLLLFPDFFLDLLQVSDSLYVLSQEYLFSMVGFIVPLFYMVFVQSFFVTAGKAGLGLVFSLCGGFANVLLDYLLISPKIGDLGIVGAGIATGMGFAVPGILGLLYFLSQKDGTLYLVKPNFTGKLLLASMYNGLSELVNSSAVAITTVLFNLILLHLVGDMGVAAISVILYLQMFQNGLFIGYTMGVAPVISYKFGENNRDALRKVIRQSLVFVTGISIFIVALTLIFREQAVGIFLEKSSSTYEMTLDGLVKFSPAYLFMGYNLFLSSMFTALSNGKTSAILSLLRSLVFLVLALLVLPLIFDLPGVWFAVPLAELLAIFVGIYFYKKYKVEYGY